MKNELYLCLGCMSEKTTEGVCPHCGFDPKTYLAAPHHLLPGTILNGKYLVGKVLGEGGFGITYVGYDLNLHMKDLNLSGNDISDYSPIEGLNIKNLIT